MAGSPPGAFSIPPCVPRPFFVGCRHPRHGCALEANCLCLCVPALRMTVLAGKLIQFIPGAQGPMAGSPATALAAMYG